MFFAYKNTHINQKIVFTHNRDILWIIGKLAIIFWVDLYIKD